MFSAIVSLFSDATPEGEQLIPDTRDPRIKAAVLLAPVGVLFRGGKSLAAVAVPVRICRAEKDMVLRYTRIMRSPSIK